MRGDSAFNPEGVQNMRAYQWFSLDVPPTPEESDALDLIGEAMARDAEALELGCVRAARAASVLSFPDLSL